MTLWQLIRAAYLMSAILLIFIGMKSDSLVSFAATVYASFLIRASLGSFWDWPEVRTKTEAVST